MKIFESPCRSSQGFDYTIISFLSSAVLAPKPQKLSYYIIIFKKRKERSQSYREIISVQSLVFSGGLVFTVHWVKIGCQIFIL